MLRGEELEASAFGGGGSGVLRGEELEASAFGGGGGGGMDSASSSSELDDDDAADGDDGDDDDDDELDDAERLEGRRCSDGGSDARGVQATGAVRSSVSVLVWVVVVADAEFVVLQFGAVVVVLAPFAAGLLALVVVVFAAAVEASFFDPSLPTVRTVVVSLRGFFFGAVSVEFLPAPFVRFFLPAVDGMDGGEQRSPK